MSIFDFLTMCTANTGKVSQQLVPKEDNCQSSSPEWTSKRWVAAVFASIHVWLQGSGYTSQVITSIPCSAGHGFEQCSNPQREQCMQPSTILWGPFSDTSPISPFDGFFNEKTMDYGLVIQLKICEKNRERDGKKCLFDASQVYTCVELLRGDTKPHSIRSHHLLHPSASPCRHQHIIVWYKLVAKILNSFCVDCLNHHRDLWLWKPQEGLSFNLEAGLRNIMVETS